MQFEKTASTDPRCLLSAAGMWMSTMEFVFGQVPIDNTRCAKIGLQASLREIASTEEELRAELEAAIGRVRASQKQSRNLERVKPQLVQCRKIKSRLGVLERKRLALENHMETIENSELNQHVLHSMQRTSNALKAMGLDKSLQSVDKVMLDLEENHSDMSSLQQTLCVNYTDDDDVDWGNELSLLLSDDCTAAPEVRNSMPARVDKVAGVPEKVVPEVEVAPEEPAAGVAAVGVAVVGVAEAEAEKKAEAAVEARA
jgi:hypothetical protein